MPPKPQLTHFLCLPLVTQSSRPQLQASLQHFASEATTGDDGGGAKLVQKAIRPIGAIHLTIGVMSLLTSERIDAACTFLRNLDVSGSIQAAEVAPVSPLPNTETVEGHSSTDRPTVSHQPRPLTITLSGLHSMHSPSKTSMLYAAPTDSPPSLLPFCNSLRINFTTAGFLVPETRELRLHATIVNTIYAQKSASGKQRWKKGSTKIDAQDLIEKWKDFEWAKNVRIEKVAICEMGAKDIMEGDKVVGQEYVEVASVPLP
ncbi:hypothetical protein MMC28_009909 [Mycoblastus sanguinarius]|nr:hypothetical protein [Mycoblastus sanguinarius]